MLHNVYFIWFMHVRVYVFSSTRVSFSLIFCFFSPFANAFNIKFNAILSCSLPSTRHFGISINKLDCLPSHMYLCVFYSTKEKRFIFLFFACMDHYRHGFIFYTLHPTHTLSLSFHSLSLLFSLSFSVSFWDILANVRASLYTHVCTAYTMTVKHSWVFVGLWSTNPCRDTGTLNFNAVHNSV